jgi:hypothetical protein
MTGIDIVPIVLSWILMLVLGSATVLGLNRLLRDRPAVTCSKADHA